VNKKSPRHAFLRMLLSSMLLLTFCFAAPVYAALSWNVEIVDANALGTGNAFWRISVDSNDNPHITYDRTGYASWNGSGWNIQEKPPSFMCDFALDANGKPHILYETGVNGALFYASWTGKEWTSQTITAKYVVYASLALDSAGNPHAAYNDGEGLKYASWTGSSWNIQTVDPNPSSVLQSIVSLSLDSNNTPYILYFNQSTYKDDVRAYNLVSVKLAVLKNSGWSIEPVLDSYNLSDCGNMVLDSKGYPRFLCTLPQPPTHLNTLLYASWNGFAWNTQTVVSDASLTSMGFLALDSHDNPNVAYVTSSAEVTYANWTGTAWDIQNAGAVPYAKGPCYLALDSKGIPHISFRGYTKGQAHGLFNATLFYATATESTEPTQLPSSPSQALPLLIVSTAVIIGTIIVTVYFKKRKH
jgi:hypothetical protein